MNKAVKQLDGSDSATLCELQLESGEIGGVEVVCPWSNTEETIVESMDEEDTAGLAPEDALSNGHTTPKAEHQVIPPPPPPPPPGGRPTLCRVSSRIAGFVHYSVRSGRPWKLR